MSPLRKGALAWRKPGERLPDVLFELSTQVLLVQLLQQSTHPRDVAPEDFPFRTDRWTAGLVQGDERLVRVPIRAFCDEFIVGI